MKGSAIREQTGSDAQNDQSAFQRFAKTMKALIAVPKHELEDKLKENAPKKRTKHE